MTAFTYQEFHHPQSRVRFQKMNNPVCATPVCLSAATGGMGGSAIMTLIRAGVGRLILADLDAFEVSNLNRQLFATLNTVDQDKARATRDQCLQINPEAEIEVLGADWPDHVERLVQSADVVINGTDDLGASLLLYRTARAKGRTVIDAYASPLPSVYVTAPGDPMPEERLGYSTRDTSWDKLTPEMRDTAAAAEAGICCDTFFFPASR